MLKKLIFVQRHLKNTTYTMKKTHTSTATIIVGIALLMPACRSSKHISSTQAQTISISGKEIDSTAHHLMATHRKTTSITVLPMQTPVQPQIPSPDVQTPAKDLITQLINQGGGTIIIEEETTTQQSQTTAVTQISQQDTTTTQNNQYQESTSKQPRASPNLKLLLYILLAVIALLILIRCRIRQ